jgi:hypothetical protein
MATLGVPPLRIDVMTSVVGVQFAEAWIGRLTAQVDALLPVSALVARLEVGA